MSVRAVIRSRACWLEAGLFLSVFSVASAVRIAKLGSIPRIISADEADNLQTAYHILDGTGPGFFGFDWKPAPIFSLYPLAWTIRVFGDSVADFRLFVVITSLLTIVLFYLLARASMGPFPAAAAMTLLATNLWFLHFSRTAWENVNSALFAVGACWAVTLALRTNRYLWWLIAGVFSAGGLYGYFSGRFIILAVVAATGLAVVARQAHWRRAAYGLSLATIVAAVLFAPMAVKIRENWAQFNNRTQNVSVFNTTEPYYGDTDGWVIAVKNVGRNYKTFVLQNGTETVRGQWGPYNPINRAPLDLITAHIFWVGLVVAAFRWRQTYVWWPFVLPLFFSEVFSRGSPDLARGIVFAPFYFLFVGMAFKEVVEHFQRPRFRGAVLAAIVAVVALVATTNVREYFDWQSERATQELRLPGIDRCEFDTWQDLAMRAAEQGTGVVDAAEFERLRDQLDCSPILRE